MAKRLVIIDGYSLLYRAFFATRFLSTSDGRPTNALFGFTSMLFLILEKERPDAVVVALDAPGKTFRHAEYSEYKGTRRETADELKAQLPPARDLIAALGIPSVEVTGFEADDVVGTISKKAEENGYDTTVVTGDLDALQLIDDCVTVMTPSQRGFTDPNVYNAAAVVERYGFGPEHITDFKAIKGDTSDNIPGVPGIGDKGAADLIQKFGTIESMLERYAEVPEKYRKKLDGNQEQLVKSKWLATIKRDVELEYDFRPFVLSDAQMEAAKAMLESLEFRSLVRRTPTVLGAYLDGASERPAPVAVESAKIEARTEEADWAGLAAFVGDRPYALFLAALPSADLFAAPERRGYVAIGDDVREVKEADAVRLLSERPAQATLHDAKPLYRRLFAETGSAPAAPGFDTMLGGYVLQSGRSAYALRDLVQGYLEVTPPESPAEMAVALGRLRVALGDRLEKEGQTRVLTEVEVPLVPVLAEMEHLGIAASREMLREFSKQLEGTIEETTRAIYDLAGQEFTIGSPKQLGEVLFDKLGLPGAVKTKTGYATGAEVLQELAPAYPIVEAVLNWRELTKLKSTYADALEKMIQPDGRIHTTYHQTVAATGRLSSNDPNLQNIPIRTELGRFIRQAFVAAEGYELVSFDYSQIELRVLAHLCGEPALVDAFRERQDVHAATARTMFDLHGAEPTKEQRRLAKMLNYAVLYGVTDFGLAQQLGGGFSRSEAKQLITLYNERFPTVREFTKAVVVEARSKGFTTTLLGRRRYFPDIHAARIQERQYAERQAMNAPIQGAAADMLKLAMLRIRPMLEGTGVRMLLNVHDELVFEFPHGRREMVEPIRAGMEEALPLHVPVEVDAKAGPNWNVMTEIPRA